MELEGSLVLSKKTAVLNQISPVHVLRPYLCKIYFNIELDSLDGVMVSVFAIGPKVRRFKPCRGDGFLRAIKIRSIPFFGGEITPEAPCRKILQCVKNFKV
jgi:hypothetical protein